jgi:16S rRNA (uracil1498-N3)-methyltransferase
MHRFFIQSGQVTDDRLSITGEDAGHIKRVLRMHAGEIIEACDEDRTVYRTEIEQLGDDEIICRILFRQVENNELLNHITLYMGLPKSDKPELIIQKAVELGASRIVPVVTKRTVVRLDAKKAASKQSRWQSVAEAAAKQSKRAVIPEIGPVLRFQEALEEAKSADAKLIPYEQEEGIKRTRDVIRAIQPGQSVAVFIGPEGGFEPSEVEAAKACGVLPVTLGRRILRAETAAIAALSILMYELER